MSPSFKPLKAYWISKEQICILLSQDWLENEILPPLYFNLEKAPILELKRAPLYLFGELAGYFREGNYITFFCPLDRFENSKKIFLAGNFNGWGAAVGKKEWQLELTFIDGKETLALKIEWDKFYNFSISLFFKFVTEDYVWLQIPAEAPNLKLDSDKNSNYWMDPNCTGQNAFIFSPFSAYDPSIFSQIMWIDEQGEYTYLVEDRILLFDLASEKPLGAIIEETNTIFRLFAPRARNVSVTFYDKLEVSGKTLSLQRNADYTWEIRYPKNLDGWYYYYTVLKDQPDGSVFGLDLKILDPYALATVGPGGPGIIIDRKLIPRIKDKYMAPDWIDLVVLEVHLRDLILNTAFGLDFQVPIGFQNLIAWLKDKNNYIKELGVNAVEFLPIQEYECESSLEYHWGYMPTNYFCPSSSYASGKGGYSQIKEFQEFVEAFHEAGIAVILDVVYNHSGSPNHLLHIDRDYYFESNQEGILTNWSGCGNDFKSNTPMGKRLIIDSLVYLIKTYDVDGFRFDLAELLGVKVMKEIENTLRAVKPSIILIAEPWSFRGHIGHALRSTGFAAWNDGYREFMANFVLGGCNSEAFNYFIGGSTSYLARFTAQSVNYASSHDDYCWIDRITENENHDGRQPTVDDIKRTHLMFSILMMSVGIPMLAEGQDILHSKGGHSNTYQRGDLNALDYGNRVKHWSTHEYFSNWIRFRLSEEGRAIRIKDIPSTGYFRFYRNESASVMGIVYNADYSFKDVKRLLFIVNCDFGVGKLEIDDTDPTRFFQVADGEQVNLDGFKKEENVWKENFLTILPLGCGLWVER